MVLLLSTVLFVALQCEVVLAQGYTRHSILWDRFWINQHLNNYTLNVWLGDIIDFNCWVNTSEAAQDKYENVVFVAEEEQLNNCNGANTTKKMGECLATMIDITIQVTDAVGLATSVSFQPGESYYFTSFSTGTVDSIRRDITQGGACTLDPPLKLTVSVLAPSSSVLLPVVTTSMMTTSVMTTSVATTTTAATIMTATPSVTLASRVESTPLHSTIVISLSMYSTFLFI